MKHFSPLRPRIFGCLKSALLTGLATAIVLIFSPIPSTGTGSFACAADESAVSKDESKKQSDEQQPQDKTEVDLKGLQEPEEKPAEIKDESEAFDPTNKDALAWYMSGQKAMKRGEFEVAAEAFQKSSDAAPEFAVPVRAHAMVLFRMGKIEEGLSKAQKAMKLDPDDYNTRLEMAVIFGSNRRFGDAIQLLEEALDSKRLDKKSFDFVHVHQVLAAVLLETRQIPRAADSYEIILTALERPEDFQLSEREHKTLLRNRLTGYEVTGRVLLEAGRIQLATRAFEALNREEKDAPGEHNLLLARTSFLQDKLEQCEENLNKYFETGRRSGESLLLLRDLYEATGRADTLTARLNELTEDASEASGVSMFLGQVLLDQGKNDEAADVYQGILDSTGEADAYLGLVRVEVANRNPTALIATLNRAVRSRITVEELNPLVASVATVDDFASQTIKACMAMYAEKPGDLHPGVPYFCALVAEQLDQETEEAGLLKASLELNPDRELSLQILDKYGMNQLRIGDYRMAAKIFEQMLSTPGLPPGTRVNTLFRISAAYASIEDLGAARKALQEALQMVPNEPQLLGRLALVEAADGKLEKAEKLLISSIEGLQDKPELLAESRLRLAGIYAQLHRWKDSAEQYLFVMDIESADAATLKMARMGLSNAYVQDGDMQKGEKVLEEIYEEDPSDPGVNNDLGYLYADQNKNLERAEQMIRIAVEAQPENPAYLDSLGWVLFRQGKNEEALKFLEKANADPEYQDATLLEHQGDVHQALQQFDEAKALWKRAMEVEQKSKRPSEDVLKRLKEKTGEAAQSDKGDDAKKQ